MRLYMCVYFCIYIYIELKVRTCTPEVDDRTAQHIPKEPNYAWFLHARGVQITQGKSCLHTLADTVGIIIIGTSWLLTTLVRM